MFNLQAAIAADAAQPANCFRVNGTLLAEGIPLTFDHPISLDSPAIMVGSYAVRRDKKNGCFYNDNSKLARRIALKRVELEGKKPFHTLVRPIANQELPLLLYVETAFERNGVTLLERFHNGIEHNGEMIAWDKGGDYLISFPNDNGHATIYYPDGDVKVIVRKDGTLVEQKLTIEDKAKARLDCAKRSLEAAHEPKTIDFWLHQIVSVMRVAGKHSGTIFQTTFDLLKAAASSGLVGASVRSHVDEVLKKHWPVEALQFALSFATIRKSTDTKLADVPSMPTLRKSGPPAEMIARKKAMSLRDQELRKKMRGDTK